MWRFNLLLLRRHEEISLSLLCSHSFWCSALDLDQLLRVGCPQASVPHPDRRQLEQQLIRALLLSQAGERGGMVIIIGMWGKPEVAEAGMTLQQPEACPVFSQGSCSWISGPWQCPAAQDPVGAVWIVTCACTQDSWWQWQQP